MSPLLTLNPVAIVPADITEIVRVPDHLDTQVILRTVL